MTWGHVELVLPIEWPAEKAQDTRAAAEYPEERAALLGDQGNDHQNVGVHKTPYLTRCCGKATQQSRQAGTCSACKHMRPGFS